MDKGRGMWMKTGKEGGVGLVLMLGSVLGGELLVLKHEPGLGYGIYMMVLGCIAWQGRRAGRTGTGIWLGTGLLVLSGLQTMRWTSFSNLLVMLVLVVGLSGMLRHGDLGNRWRQWLEGGLVFLRPLGVLERYRESGSGAESQRAERAGRLGLWLKILWPAVVLLFIFGILLGGGNAVLGKWIQETIVLIEDALVFWGSIPSPGRIVSWLFFAWIGLAIYFGAKSTRLTRITEIQWPFLGRRDDLLRGYQWFAALLVMNLLFLLSTISDVIYLWLSRELPEGISHSRYLHQGVGALILTTLLSAAVLGLLTQHGEPIRTSRFIRWLSIGWIVQNLILISGVFLRLWIYVEAYAYTPRRIYVMLFLNLVICGFGLLIWALLRLHTLKWLIGANLILLFGHFMVLQLVDIPGLVASWNGKLYQSGELGFPERQYLEQIGSHAIPYLVTIHDHPQEAGDRERALEELDRCFLKMHRIENRPWQSFQIRDYRNWKKWRTFREQHGSISNQTSPAGGAQPAEEHP